MWTPALELVGLEHRRRYDLRHTLAHFSLRAGVPISDLAREMGHRNVQRTYRSYGQWCAEQGERAANLRHVGRSAGGWYQCGTNSPQTQS